MTKHLPSGKFYKIGFFCLLMLMLATSSGQVKAQWVKANLPGIYANGYYLDVYFLPADQRYGWACGLEGYVVRTTDGGQTWAGVDLPDFLESIQFLTPLIGYVSGPAGIFKSYDGGASWTNITPFGAEADKTWGCYFITQNEGVFLSGGCADGLQRFYRTSDGGFTWSVSYGNEAKSGLSDAIIYLDGHGYAVSSGVLWWTDDYGQRWHYYSSTGSKYWTEELAIYDKSFLLPTSGTDCDGQTRGVGSLRFSVDEGRSFREFQTGANMFGTYLVNEEVGWGVGDGGAVYQTLDAGRNWQLRNCGISGDLDDIFFVNDTLAWITGEGLYRSNFNAPRIPVFIEPNVNVIEICKGDSVLLDATQGFTTYTWSDGVRASARFVKDSGTYIIAAFDKMVCQDSYDTIRIQFLPSIDPTITADKSEVCEGDSITLTLNGDFVSKTWSTGDTSRSIVVKSSGTYSITTLDQYGCTRIASSIPLTVHPNPKPIIKPNRKTTICKDEFITLAAPPGYYKYEWSNGSIDESITVNTEASYVVTVTDEFGCVGTSPGVYVTVLDISNMIKIDLASAGGELYIPEHTVGSKRCVDLVIRNISKNLDLNISNPWLIGNVFCSIPQAQLPFRIAPQESSVLTICCAAIDSGSVADTLVLPDTCSPTFVPIRSYGLTIDYQGSSRCEVGVGTVVYRAGSSYMLSAPYPLPADDEMYITIQPGGRAIVARLYDELGIERGMARVYSSNTAAELRFDTSLLTPGTYYAVIEMDGEILARIPAQKF